MASSLDCIWVSLAGGGGCGVACWRTGLEVILPGGGCAGVGEELDEVEEGGVVAEALGDLVEEAEVLVEAADVLGEGGTF